LKKRTARFWHDELEAEEANSETVQGGKKWRERAKKVVARYRDERSSGTAKKLNILWSNIETLKPTIFSKMPEPDVRRRFKDQDPVGRTGSEILERALAYVLDDYGAAQVFEGVRDDGLIAGRGQAWIEYEPYISRERPELVPGEPQMDPMGGMAMDERGQPVMSPDQYMLGDRPVEPDGEDDDGPYIDEKVDERVYCCLVPWKYFRHAPEPQWKDVWWVARGHMMTREDLHENFDESLGKDKVKALPLQKHKGSEDKDRGAALVWEIWDKKTRKVYWVHDQWKDQILKDAEDPLNLEQFFPCPEPYTPIRTTDDWTPIPEYTLYQDQAEEIDNISARIATMVKAVRPRGGYAKDMEGVANILQGDDLDLVPIDNFERFAEKGGLNGGVMWLPLDMLSNVIAALYEARNQSKQELYEVTGLSDLVRGSTKASETATAQQLKGNYGSMRMQPRQVPFARFVRDVLRIMAEVIAEHYSPETLQRMTGMEASPEVMEMLRSDKLRGYRIDVETDATVAPDQQAEKESMVEFVSSITQYMQGIGPVVQASPPMAKPLMEILKMVTRQFKAGRPVEDALDEAADQVMQIVSQPQPDPGQAEAQAEMQKAQAQAQMDMQRAQLQAQTDLHREQIKADVAREKAQREAQTDMERAQLDRQTEIDKARIGAEVDITKAEIHSRSAEREAALRDRRNVDG